MKRPRLSPAILTNGRDTQTFSAGIWSGRCPKRGRIRSRRKASVPKVIITTHTTGPERSHAMPEVRFVAASDEQGMLDLRHHLRSLVAARTATNDRVVDARSSGGR